MKKIHQIFILLFLTGILFAQDVTAPTISSTAPAQDASIKDTKVSYTLSEAVASGTVTFTRTGGSVDGSSPHEQD